MYRLCNAFLLVQLTETNNGKNALIFTHIHYQQLHLQALEQKNASSGTKRADDATDMIMIR